MGRRINSARAERGMTQEAWRRFRGWDRTYISLVEHGKQNVTIGAVLKIANALDMPIGDLAGRKTGIRKNCKLRRLDDIEARVSLYYIGPSRRSALSMN